MKFPGRQCTATSKRTGERCRGPAVRGRNVCRMHGGHAGRPLKTGRYSKRLPHDLLELHQDALNDRRLLELRDEIALIDTRTSAVLRGLSTGESGAPWRALRQLWDRCEAGDAVALAAAGALIRQGSDNAAAWAEVQALIEQRRRLVDSERRRLVEMQQMVTAEQASALLLVIVDAVRRVVGVEKAAALGDELRRHGIWSEIERGDA